MKLMPFLILFLRSTTWLGSYLPPGLMQPKSGLPRLTPSLQSKLWLFLRQSFIAVLQSSHKNLQRRFSIWSELLWLGLPMRYLRKDYLPYTLSTIIIRDSKLWSFFLSSKDQKPSHLMNRMLVLLPDDYKPDFILQGLFLGHLSTEVQSHLLQEKISDPKALALKADNLFQTMISLPVNLLGDLPEDSFQVNTVVSCSFLPPLAKRSSTPASSARSPPSPDLCWSHTKSRDKAVNCRKPCSASEN